MTRRRDFLVQLGAAAALRPAALAAAPNDSEWDTAWLDRLAEARWRVVFNATELADGSALDAADAVLDGYREVHGARDGEARPVVVYRRSGTPLAMGDALWERYAVTDARRNPYLPNKIVPLQRRGLVLLVCSVSLRSWSSRFAEKSGRPAEDVLADVKANLVPGAIPVPSGVWALVRAQNAGCAYMNGT
jgi:intracellular sulfur oxidation DsrE/DsrF family protein